MATALPSDESVFVWDTLSYIPKVVPAICLMSPSYIALVKADRAFIYYFVDKGFVCYFPNACIYYCDCAYAATLSAVFTFPSAAVINFLAISLGALTYSLVYIPNSAPVVTPSAFCDAFISSIMFSAISYSDAPITSASSYNEYPFRLKYERNSLTKTPVWSVSISDDCGRRFAAIALSPALYTGVCCAASTIIGTMSYVVNTFV